MTFLAPGFFFASLAVAAGVIALHFIVTRQPRAGILPTARFVPNLPATATAKHTRASDILLMLLRALLVLAAGAGMARPVFKPSRGAEARVILADVSRSMRDTALLRDSVRALYRNHDVLIAFDSSVRNVQGDSIATLMPGRRRGSLGAALIAAQRAGSALRDHADSIELVIVSPFAEEELDASTLQIRSLWPGRARLVQLSSTQESMRDTSTLDVRGAAADPLQIAAGLARTRGAHNALVIRDGSTTEPADGKAVIDWPVSTRPRGAIPRTNADAIGGVTAGQNLVVASFDRKWSYPSDSIRGADIVARWIDGEPAALEWPAPSGCTRSVAVPITPVGDLVLRNDFARFISAVTGECASRAAMRPADPGFVDRLAGSGRLASHDAFLPRGDVRSTIAPWLIALAIALAIIELFVRRRRVSAVASQRVREMERAA